MPVYERQCTLPASAGEAYAWHGRPGALERLSPPWRTVHLLTRAPGLSEGQHLVLQVRIGPLSQRWATVIRESVPGVCFVDEQVEGPFARWVHTHSFESLAEHLSILKDRVEYELPLGSPAELVAGRRVVRTLERLFAFRQVRTRDDLARHAEYSELPPLRVAVTGASGMIGAQLTAFLESGGHTVLRLVRPQAYGGGRSIGLRRLVRPQAYGGEIFWDPAAHTAPDSAPLEGLDAVVHLAGASIAGARWTPAQRRAILESRVAGTSLIAQTLAGLDQPPRVFLSASAIGIYGSRGDEELTEQSAASQGFLPDVATAWEAATAPAREAGIRTVTLRSGLVLSGRGGALTAMLPAFKAAAAGPIGGGRQWISWISLEDWLGAALWLIRHDSVDGPVNIAAPQPVTNRDLTTTLGRVLGRAAKLPLPAVAVRLGFGEMGERLLLDSARVVPRRLLDGGFSFLYPDLESALRVELGLLSR
jgi:uncharacterized protein (TIGR01777 family)